MRRHWDSVAAIAVWLVSAAAPVIGQTGGPLSLSQAVTAALESQPAIRSAQLAVDLADKRIDEARARRLPAIRLSETLTRGNNPVFVFGSLLEQSQFGPQNFSLPALNNPAPITNLRTAITSSVPAFDGMRTSSRISQAAIGRKEAVQHKTLAEQQVRFSVVRDYFGVLVADASRSVADEAIRMAQSDVKRAGDRVDAGLAVQSDVLAAQVQLAEFTEQQIQAEGNQATARVVLNVLIGLPPEAEHRLTDELNRKSFPLSEQAELIRRAMLNRPDYLQADSAIELAQRRVSEQRADYLPELNLFGSLGSSAGNLTTGSSDYAVGASLTFNLFDAGRGSRLNQAHIQEATAQTERDRLADQITIDVIRAYHDYRAAEQQLEVAEAALAQASEGLRIIQDRYDAGLTTITDVLRAETAMVRARMNVIAARQSQYVHYASVLLAIGELNDVDAFQK